MVRLERDEARRIAVRAQLLDADRPTDLVAMVEHLTLLQLDPTASIAPSADLVAWSRLGNGYASSQLTLALADRELFELDAFLRPMSQLAVVLGSLAGWPPYASTRRWMDANDAFRRDLLARLREQGASLSRDLPDTAQVAWRSTGWTHERNVTQMLECLTLTGEVAIAGRVGRQRVFDLAERVYPSDLVLPPKAEAVRLREELRLRASGIARVGGTVVPGEPYQVGEAGVEAEVVGVPGRWRVDPAQLDRPFTGRTALLSPFDRLVHDRARAEVLFGFAYVLEMYKPAAARRWGYYALPVLHGDRLVGKLDATADRKGGRLVVNAVHEDEPFTPEVRAAVDAEVAALAAWLGLDVDARPSR
ncbi:MAG: winged helix DNA-binding domain-containing protein [Actinobacteria bacterium]|nr:winged helix DNA-binding domain-containing protein [Actinomycetota bacterium]